MDIKLIMFREDRTRREFPLPMGTTTIGRKDDCGIRIPLAVVSRRHAEILVEDDVATVRCLGAANGTFLNNRRIEEEDLEPGDTVMVGPVIFTVQIDGDPSDDEMIAIRTKVSVAQRSGDSGASVGTSEHVYMSDEETDPIAALEALASSTDQTAIDPEDQD